MNSIVNPISLENCRVRWNGEFSDILDLSFSRVVAKANPIWENIPAEEQVTLELILAGGSTGTTLSLPVKLHSKNEQWVRFTLPSMPPKTASQLRYFLSPKRIGESLLKDWFEDTVWHFHGLNESELWLSNNGTILFTYLDTSNPNFQFIFRNTADGGIQVGRLERLHYMELTQLDGELPLLAVPDKEIFQKMSECRDIITNFRPTGQYEYNVKQKLLKIIGDQLYSTGNRSERPRSVTAAV